MDENDFNTNMKRCDVSIKNVKATIKEIVTAGKVKINPIENIKKADKEIKTEYSNLRGMLGSYILKVEVYRFAQRIFNQKNDKEIEFKEDLVSEEIFGGCGETAGLLEVRNTYTQQIILYFSYLY